MLLEPLNIVYRRGQPLLDPSRTFSSGNNIAYGYSFQRPRAGPQRRQNKDDEAAARVQEKRRSEEAR